MEDTCEEELIGSLLSIPMGYVGPPLLCMSTDTVSDITNMSMGERYSNPHCLIEGLVLRILVGDNGMVRRVIPGKVEKCNALLEAT